MQRGRPRDVSAGVKDELSIHRPKVSIWIHRKWRTAPMVRLWAMKWSLVQTLQIPQISCYAMNLREQLNLNWTRDKQMQLIHGLNPSNRLLIGCAIQLILLKQKAFHKFIRRRHFKWHHRSASVSARQNLLNPTSRPCQLKSRGRFPQNFNWKTSEGCNEWNSADVIISKLNSITRFHVDYINSLPFLQLTANLQPLYVASNLTKRKSTVTRPSLIHCQQPSAHSSPGQCQTRWHLI